jgi:hypothetical protein
VKSQKCYGLYCPRLTPLATFTACCVVLVFCVSTSPIQYMWHNTAHNRSHCPPSPPIDRKGQYSKLVTVYIGIIICNMLRLLCHLPRDGHRCVLAGHCLLWRARLCGSCPGPTLQIPRARMCVWGGGEGQCVSVCAYVDVAVVAVAAAVLLRLLYCCCYCYCCAAADVLLLLLLLCCCFVAVFAVVLLLLLCCCC